MSSFSQQVPERARSQKLWEGKLVQPTSLCKFQLLWSKIMSHPGWYFKNTKAASVFFPELHCNWNYSCTLSRDMPLVHELHTWLQDWVIEVQRMPRCKDNWSVLACKYWIPESHHNSSKVPVFTRNLMCRVDFKMDRQLAGALKRSFGRKRC